jgi:hypothetical protein
MGREPLSKETGRVRPRYAVMDGFMLEDGGEGGQSEDVAGHGRSKGGRVAPHAASTATGVGNGLQVKRKPVPVARRGRHIPY